MILDIEFYRRRVAESSVIVGDLRDELAEIKHEATRIALKRKLEQAYIEAHKWAEALEQVEKAIEEKRRDDAAAKSRVMVEQQAQEVAC